MNGGPTANLHREKLNQDVLKLDVERMVQVTGGNPTRLLQHRGYPGIKSTHSSASPGVVAKVPKLFISNNF